MTQIFGIPNQRRASNFNRNVGQGTPFLGRRTTINTASLTDLTDFLMQPTMSGAGATGSPNTRTSTPQNDLTAYLHAIELTVTPRTGAAALTENAQLVITDGFAKKTLYFMAPSDYAQATFPQPLYKFSMKPEGRIAIPPGYKIQTQVSNAEMFAAPAVTGTVDNITNAQKRNYPIASDVSGTVGNGSSGVTIVMQNNGVLAETNSLAGKFLRMNTATATGTVGQTRTIISNTTQTGTGGAATGTGTTGVFSGRNCALNIVVDQPFSTDPSSGDIVEVVSGDFWIASARFNSTTPVILQGSITGQRETALTTATGGSNTTFVAAASSFTANIYTGGTIRFTGNVTAGLAGIKVTITGNSTTTITFSGGIPGGVLAPASGDTAYITVSDGCKAKCLRVEGWYFSGLNSATAAASDNCRILFLDRQGENSGTLTSEAGNTARTIHRWHLVKGNTAVTTPAGNAQTRFYQQQAVDDCEITGPPGYGLVAVASGANITNHAAVTVWGRFVDADAHEQYTPHGLPFCGFQAPGGSNPSLQLFRPNEKFLATAASAGPESSITFGTAGWTTACFVGAYVSIVAGTGAGQTRKIVGNTGTVLRVTPAWTTTPSTDSVGVISGFQGQRYWFCVDQTSAVTTGSVQGFFASEKYSALDGTSIPNRFGEPNDVIVDGLVASGQGNGAASAALAFLCTADNTAANRVGPTIVGAPAANTALPCMLAVTKAPWKVTPVNGLIASDSNLTTGFGLGTDTTNGAWTTLCVTVWGKRMKPLRSEKTSDVNASPEIQGS